MKPPIRYTGYTASDAGEMARLLGKVFAKRDPPAVAVGLTPGEFAEFVQLWCGKAAEEGLTILARCGETGEIVGAMLAEDSASAMPAGLDGISPKFLPILDLLGGLDAAYRETHNPAPGETLHLFLLGVDERFSGRGIAQQLVQRAIANGESKGYRLAVTEATNLTSQHVFRKLGFTERVRASYAGHRFEGAGYFGSIADHGGPILMDKPVAGFNGA